MKEVTFDEVKQLQSEGKKLLVDFKAEWCGPCRTLSPRLSGIEKDYPNVEFVAIDIDKNKDAAKELGIRSIPMVHFYDGSKLVNTLMGAQPEASYKTVLNDL